MTTSRQSRNRKNVTPTKAKTAAAPAAVVSEKTSAAAAPAAAPSTAAAAPPPAANGAYSWTHDYDYVKKDLRKLGIVSLVLFAAIIAAGFFM